MNAPRLFALYCAANCEVIFVSQSWSSVHRMLMAVDEPLRKLYQIVRYDPWDDSAKYAWIRVENKKGKTK